MLPRADNAAMGQLDGKTAVITGSTRGLGNAIAAAFLAEGARVVVSGRHDASARIAAEKLDPTGTHVLAIRCDVSNLQSVRELSRGTIEHFGRYDIWVNNAGLSAPFGPTALIPADMFASVLNTNIIGTYYGTHCALQHFVPERRGKIVNILGRGDTGAVPLQAAYSTSKFWLKAFTETVAKEQRDSGVGIFGYNPGLMTTEFLSHAEAIEGYEARLNPLKTVVRMWGNPPEVPALEIVKLCSPATDGKTGLIRSQMHTAFMLGGAIREGARRLFRRPLAEMTMNVKSVKATIAR